MLDKGPHSLGTCETDQKESFPFPVAKGINKWLSHYHTCGACQTTKVHASFQAPQSFSRVVVLFKVTRQSPGPSLLRLLALPITQLFSLFMASAPAILTMLSLLLPRLVSPSSQAALAMSSPLDLFSLLFQMHPAVVFLRSTIWSSP